MDELLWPSLTDVEVHMLAGRLKMSFAVAKNTIRNLKFSEMRLPELKELVDFANEIRRSGATRISKSRTTN
jgi:hypothetical protein